MPLKGITSTTDDGAKYFHVTVRANVEGQKGWQGGSGCPVLVNESIVGVVINMPNSYDPARFKVYPVIRLLENAEFRGCVDYSEAEDQRSQLMNAAVEALSQSDEAIGLLSPDPRFLPGSDRRESASQVVNELMIDANPVKVAQRFIKPMRQMLALGDSKAQTRQALMSTAMHLIPASLTRTQVPQVRVVANGRTQKFAFEANTKAFVEVAVARLHARPIRYREQQGQRIEPAAILRLDSPVESEFDKNGDKFKQDFVSGLHYAMSLRTLKDATFAAQVEQINRALELRETLQEARHYYVFEIPRNEDKRARQVPLINELDKLLPRLIFITIEQDQITEEKDNCVDLLIRILLAAAGREWKDDAQDKIPQ